MGPSISNVIRMLLTPIVANEALLFDVIAAIIVYRNRHEVVLNIWQSKLFR